MALTLPAMLRRDQRRSRVTSALVIVTGAAAATFVSYLGYAVRCSQFGCEVAPEKAAGLYPWWRTELTWQWGAQMALASLGLVIAAAALALAVRERRSARRAVNAARLVYALWAIAVFLVPAFVELFLL